MLKFLFSENNKKILFTEMKFIEFKNKIQHMPVFSTFIFEFTKNQQVLRNQIVQWTKKGLILKLKKGVYMLGDADRKITPSKMFVANQLYFPSYVSNEYALQFYNLIPEKVVDVTSVTTKKTATFKNIYGIFRYQHIKIEYFFGYKILKDENHSSFFIAEPEKAVIDFLYFNLSNFSKTDKDIFEKSYRFQNVDILNTTKLRKIAEIIGNKKLLMIVDNFINFVKL